MVIAEPLVPIEEPRAASRALTLDELVERSLAEQRDLSAVERFSQWHEGRYGEPLQARHYHSLLPAAPQVGEQYAFEVDLDACSGCKSCVVACHALNGLDEHESWRDVGLLLAPTESSAPASVHVTTACHHCVEPACASACPVNAYEKDRTTGVVRHLDDQCIGCQYCTLACPYDVPKYHAGKGIVRKCDMCTNRLAAGEAPACVQSCPNQAIRITVVRQAEIADRSSVGTLVPGAVGSDFTRPTTQFRTARRELNALLPADGRRATPQHAHAALVAMLVLTQGAVGALVMLAAWLLGRQGELNSFGVAAGGASFVTAMTTLAGVLVVAGVAASTFHLGRPLYAFRAVLGVGHSWLSREILAFGAMLPFAAGACFAAWGGDRWSWTRQALAPLVLSAAVAGIVAVVCSAKIYQFTRRPFWVGAQTGVKFALGAAGVGAVAAWLSAAAVELSDRTAAAFAVLFVASMVVKLAFEARQLAWPEQQVPDPGATLAKSAALLRNELRRTAAARFVCGAGGVGVALLSLALSGFDLAPAVQIALAAAAACLCLAGELLERTLFFQAVVPHKMPGGIAR
ncbi:MAG: dimethyl sulfoxide reductase anchor subunit [Pirellulales bacterium]|nr:dimethyl sulfoxide reductase anchor subunit [Pirellulales bacterium]